MGVQLGAGGGRRSGRRKAFRQMSEINVTPFVDVMLVLLIVFMVTAPLLTVGVPVDLPKTNAPPLAVEAPIAVAVLPLALLPKPIAVEPAPLAVFPNPPNTEA